MWIQRSGGRGWGGGPPEKSQNIGFLCNTGPDPLKITKLPEKSQNIGFLCNTGPDPLKITKLPSQIQCWAIIGSPAKRHLRRADDGPFTAVFKSSIPSSTNKKKEKKSYQIWTPSDKTFWIRACSDKRKIMI